LCHQTDGSVPNTLVIANCEVVKPRVAAAEHISQVLCGLILSLCPFHILLHTTIGFMFDTYILSSENVFSVQWRSTFSICEEVQDHHSPWRGVNSAHS